MTLEHNQWWLNLLGVDTSNIPAAAKLQIEWTWLPQSWQWFVLLGILGLGAWGVFWLYRREIDTCPMWAKIVLGGLRTFALLLLLIVIFGPMLVYSTRMNVLPNIYVLRDDSQSMQFKDGYLSDETAAHVAKVLDMSVEEVRSQRPNRAEILQAALGKNDWELIRKLQGDADEVRLVNYSNRVDLVGSYRSTVDANIAARDNPEDRAALAASLSKSRTLAGVSVGLFVIALMIGAFTWYGATNSVGTWITGLLAVGFGIAALAVAGANAVYNPNISLPQIVAGLDKTKPADDTEDKQPGAEEKDKPKFEPPPPLEAQGQGSDLYDAIALPLRERNVAAAVVLSDGQNTGHKHSRDELIALAAQANKPENERVRLIMVGVGDSHRPRNLAVTDVYAPPQALPGKTIEIAFVVRGQDVGDRQVRIDLLEQQLNDDGSPAGEPKVIKQLTGEVIPESGKLAKKIKVEADRPGTFAYTVRVEQIENESNLDDNQPASPTLVKVLEAKAKVLLVAGSPTWEYRMVQRLLTREDTVDLSCWLQTLDENRAQEGDADAIIQKLPVERKELFGYDVVMLFDPDPIEFDEEWITLLKEFVSEHAGGVLYMAGPKFSGRFLGAPRTRTMRDVLPVRLGDVSAIEVQHLLETNTREWKLGIVKENVDVPIMDFEGNQIDSLRIWESLPGIYWSFPADGAKPAARVLIEHSDPTMRNLSALSGGSLSTRDIGGNRPLLVAGQYGSGRTVYMGFNGTWRWRKVGHNAEYFKRFWVAATDYLIEGRSREGERRGYVEVDRARYELGDKVNIVVNELTDENFNKYNLPEIQIEVQPEGGPPTLETIPKLADQDGVYQKTIQPKTTGRYTVRVKMPPGTGEPPKIETSFAVTLPTVETNEVALNKSLLVDIANASGGAYLEIDQLDQAANHIPDRIRSTERPEKPLLLWDTNRLLLLLVLVLSVEWGMRKGFKLL